MSICPHCGGTIFPEKDNFCTNCGHQLRKLSPEDAALVAPEDQRRIPMPVIPASIIGSAAGFVYRPELATELGKTFEAVEISSGPCTYNLYAKRYRKNLHRNTLPKKKKPIC